jgi:hypothetical protein
VLTLLERVREVNGSCCQAKIPQSTSLIYFIELRPGKYNPNFYDKPNLPNWKFLSGKRKGLEDTKAIPPVGTYNVRGKEFEKKEPDEINSLKWFSQTPSESRKLVVG